MKYAVPNVVRGGRAIPLNNSSNLFYMKGRKHNKGGIDIGKDARTGIEVEDDEVMQLNNNNIRVFSSEPFLSGNSPSHLVMNGADPNAVFNAQEAYKKAHHLNDDGTRKAKHGKGLTRKKDYVSSDKPYPSVASGDFAGGGRSYPIPTKADAVDALRLAGLHGREDVKAKVYAKYPELRKKASLGTMLKKFRHIRNLFNTNRYVSGDELEYGGRRKAATGTLKQFTPFTEDILINNTNAEQSDNEYENSSVMNSSDIGSKWIPNIIKKDLNTDINSQSDVQYPQLDLSSYYQPNNISQQQESEEENKTYSEDPRVTPFLKTWTSNIHNNINSNISEEDVNKFKNDRALEKERSYYNLEDMIENYDESIPLSDYLLSSIEDHYKDRIEQKGEGHDKVETPGNILWDNTANDNLMANAIKNPNTDRNKNILRCATKLWNKAKSAGLSDAQALTLVGDVAQESGFEYDCENSDTGAYGLFQMMNYTKNKGTLQNYQDWCKKYNREDNEDSQMDFVISHMKNGKYMTGAVAKTWDGQKMYEETPLEAEETSSHGFQLDKNGKDTAANKHRGNKLQRYWKTETNENVNDPFKAMIYFMYDFAKGREHETHLRTRLKNGLDFYAYIMSQQNKNNQQKKLGGNMRIQYKKGGSKVLRKKAEYGDEEDKKTEEHDEKVKEPSLDLSSSSFVGDNDEILKQSQKPNRLVDPTKTGNDEPIWQTQFDWENMSNLGLNTLGSIIGGGVNAAMLNKRKYIGPPVLLPASKMRTKYNINPQIGTINSALDDIVRNTNNNTASSKVANNRNNTARLTALQQKNQAYADKNNKEAELINKDVEHRDEVRSKNVKAINNWRKDKNEFENTTREKKAENINDMMSNLNTSLQHYTTNREKARQFDMNMAVFAASHPNTSPEIYKYWMERLGSPTFFRKVNYNANNRTKKRSKK